MQLRTKATFIPNDLAQGNPLCHSLEDRSTERTDIEPNKLIAMLALLVPS